MPANAVVLGASMAGLCAARVLADRFDQVVVLDRDELPSGPEWRKQVPQGRHPHLLLVAGAQQLERWFPGIIDELHAGGAVDVDLTADVYWHQAGGVARRPESTLHGPSMSRPFLEWTVRHRVEALANVDVRTTTAARGLRLDDSGLRVEAVEVAGGGDVACDLVVDATGRQAHSLGWLEALGYEQPRVSRVEIDTRYVSQMFRRSDVPRRDWKVAGIIDDPSSKRLALALPVEDDRWHVVFGGVHGEVAPIDLDERLAYAKTFPVPQIADIMAMSEPVGEPATHRFVSSQRRHVERMKRFPLGWVLLGDAIASFNPIYGQGMTSAALQADALATAFDRSGRVDATFTRRYFKAAGRVVDVAWSTAVGSDFAYADTTGKKSRGTDLVNRYIDRVMVAGQRVDAVALRFNEVVAMVRQPESLFAPRFALRVLRHSRRRKLVGVPAGSR